MGKYINDRMVKASKLRLDIINLSEIVGERLLLVSAIRETLLHVYQDEYQYLTLGSITSCIIPFKNLKLKVINGRKWILVEKNEINIKSKRKPGRFILCKGCRTSCSGDGKIYICKKCGLKHTWSEK